MINFCLLSSGISIIWCCAQINTSYYYTGKENNILRISANEVIKIISLSCSPTCHYLINDILVIAESQKVIHNYKLSKTSINQVVIDFDFSSLK